MAAAPATMLCADGAGGHVRGQRVRSTRHAGGRLGVDGKLLARFLRGRTGGRIGVAERQLLLARSSRRLVGRLSLGRSRGDSRLARSRFPEQHPRLPRSEDARVTLTWGWCTTAPVSTCSTSSTADLMRTQRRARPGRRQSSARGRGVGAMPTQAMRPRGGAARRRSLQGREPAAVAGYRSRKTTS